MGAFHNISYISNICITAENGLFICQCTKLGEQPRQFRIHIRIGELAGTYFSVAAAVVFEHKTSDIDIRGSVQNAVADRRRTALAAASVHNPYRNVLLGVHAVYHKTVAGINRVHAS